MRHSQQRTSQIWSQHQLQRKLSSQLRSQKRLYRPNGVQITTTNHEEKQKCQPKTVFASTTKKSDQLTKEEPERVSNSGPEQKKEVVSVKESTFRCNICNISCTGENNFPRVISCPNMLELKTYLIPHVLSYHFWVFGQLDYSKCQGLVVQMGFYH